MNYDEAIDYLFAQSRKALPKNLLSYLERPKLLQSALGYPDKHYQTVHIAGTNGKGSLTTKLAVAMTKEGFKTGRFTSPHIEKFNERIAVDGELISDHDVATLATLLKKTAKSLEIELTFFEAATLMTLKYFQNKKVDFAIMETGLGGLYDATNIILPKLCCITSISLDHCELLGKTIDEIAKEKAGIIKEGVPVVIGPKVPLKIIEGIAIQKKAPVIQVNGSFTSYLDENNAIARKCMEILNLSKLAIETGLSAMPPCRFEKRTLKEGTTLILDVAHNPDGFLELFKALKKHTPGKFRLVVGFSKGKEIDLCLDVLNKQNSPLHFVEINHEKALPLSELKLLAKHFPATFHSSCKEGLIAAINLAKQQNETVVVCGSFYLMHEILAAIKDF